LVDWFDFSRPTTPGELGLLPRTAVRAVRRRWWIGPVLKPREFPETRASLLASMQAGPGAASWREFFDRYSPAVYRIARLRGLAAHDAEDIVQQTMLLIARHIERFDYDRDRGRFRQWVRSIAESKITDYLRRPRGESELANIEVSTEVVDMEAAWAEQWKLQDLLWCLEEVAVDFAPRRVEAFRLYVMEGLPAAEVAQRTQLTVGHVYVTRTQIINRVRERMRELAEPTETTGA